jgi:hypothetical protein
MIAAVFCGGSPAAQTSLQRALQLILSDATVQEHMYLQLFEMQAVLVYMLAVAHKLTTS